MVITLLHGFTQGPYVWDTICPVLEDAGFQVFRPTLAGSGPKPWKHALTMDSMAYHVREQLDSEGIHETILMGHSMGGYVALALAHAMPKRIRGLGLIHSTPFADSEERKAIRDRVKEVLASKGTHTYLQGFTPGLFTERHRESMTETIHDIIAKGSAIPAENLMKQVEAMKMRPDRTSMLQHCDFPVLGILGRDDTLISYSPVFAALATARCAFIELLNDSAHMGMYEENDLLAAMLIKFSTFVRSIKTS
jgi:pimeloyl-ACP methyl ester carboxylesterase